MTYQYITRGEISRKYIEKEIKMIAPTWNDEFEASTDFCAVLEIKDYI